MTIAGLDIGSTYIKFAFMRDDSSFLFEKVETGTEPLSQCFTFIERFNPDIVISTGYGRHLLEDHINSEAITEIKAFAIAAKKIFPNCRTIIDIGGQDTKVISLDDNGRLIKFEMNDRCAAGTGKFIEIMAKKLGYSIEEFNNLFLADTSLQLSGICTVFVESEVVSLIAKGVPRENIATAIIHAVANKVSTMLKRVGVVEEIVFAGGCAKNKALKTALETKLEKKLLVSENADFLGAIGAAYYGQNNI